MTLITLVKERISIKMNQQIFESQGGEFPGWCKHCNRHRSFHRNKPGLPNRSPEYCEVNHGIFLRGFVIQAVWLGELLESIDLRAFKSDEQAAGAYRHRVADTLIQLGVHVIDAADFATSAIIGLE